MVTVGPEIEVVVTAIDPCIAQDKMLRLSPDVLLLGIGLPRRDGLTFLKMIRRQHPMPAAYSPSTV